MNNSRDKYDVVIIGAGISGLVCSCYLSKSGKKVLLVEKNDKIGGYCSAISKNDFKFNLTTCTLGSLRQDGGVLSKIFYKELNLANKILVKRNDPSTTIVTNDGIFDFDSSGKELTNNLISFFPNQSKEIRAFISLLLSPNSLELYIKYKNLFFGELLDHFFSDKKLKNFFAIACGIFGTLPYKISAFSALIYYKETIFDGGYYVLGGIEKLSEKLLEEFMNNKGAILLSTKVDKIKIGKNKNVESVILSNGRDIKTNYLVSCCDARETFLNLIGENKLKKSFVDVIRNMLITSSVFIVYLGLKKPLSNKIKKYKSRNIWLAKGCEIEEDFHNLENGKYEIDKPGYLLCSLSSSKEENLINQITIYTLAPFKSKSYWNKNKNILSQNVIESVESIIPNITNNIKTKILVTPIDLYSYTLNFNGAIKGWASIPIQNDSRKIPQGKIFNNLYTAGQWRTLESGQGGIAMASFSGRAAAKAILRNKIRQ